MRVAWRRPIPTTRVVCIASVIRRTLVTHLLSNLIDGRLRHGVAPLGAVLRRPPVRHVIKHVSVLRRDVRVPYVVRPEINTQ